MEERNIPKYLNAQPQILWWDLDEFIVLLLFTGLGIVANHQFIGTIIGILAMKAYSKLSTIKHPGFIKHFAYSLGIYGIKEIPEYWVKEIVR